MAAGRRNDFFGTAKITENFKNVRFYVFSVFQKANFGSKACILQQFCLGASMDPGRSDGILGRKRFTS